VNARWASTPRAGTDRRRCTPGTGLQSVLAGRAVRSSFLLSRVCGLPPGGLHPTELHLKQLRRSSNYAERGFHAVGSAAGFALLGSALLAHFRPAERPLSQGRLIAYRGAAIQTSMFGVGGGIQMWYVDADGVHEVGEDEMAEVKSNVGGWQDEEGKLLDRTFGSEPSSPEPAPPPPETTA
jgi:hypothetical protein